MSQSDDVVVGREVLETMCSAVREVKDHLEQADIPGEQYKAQHTQAAHDRLIDLIISLEALCQRQS